MAATFTERTRSLLSSYFVSNPKTVVRMDKPSAKEVLLNNMYVMVDGDRRYLVIRHIGIDVYQLGLRIEGKGETILADGNWDAEREWVVDPKF